MSSDHNVLTQLMSVMNRQIYDWTCEQNCCNEYGTRWQLCRPMINLHNDIQTVYYFVMLSGPPTNVGIDFFVQTFGPLNEVAMVSLSIILLPATAAPVLNLLMWFFAPRWRLVRRVIVKFGTTEGVFEPNTQKSAKFANFVASQERFPCLISRKFIKFTRSSLLYKFFLSNLGISV